MIHNTKILAMTGGYAAAEALRQMAPDVMAVYPITPQTPIIETFAKMHADGHVATEIIQVESEHSAMSAAVGASAAGARTVTATSSQGLLLMHEILHIASGSRLPILMYVSARAVSAPLNIHGEHGDVMAVREAGWVQLFAENAQEAYELGLLGLRLAEESSFPVMVVMDGFQTSHTTERVQMFADEAVAKFVGVYQPEKYLLDLDNPVSFGSLALQNSYFEFRLDQQADFLKVPRSFHKIARQFKELSGARHKLVETYKLDDAKSALVIMGATTGTAKEAVDQLRAQGEKVGLLQIKMFRPFPYKEVAHELAHIKNIAVLDRALSTGAYPPLCQEVISSLHHPSSKKHTIASYVYGLGGRDTMQAQIKKVFYDLEKGSISEKIKYLT